MKGFHGNIEKETLQNENFRKVLYTSSRSQIVLMCLLPGEEIGEEIHVDNDQFFRFEQGIGKGIVDGHEYEIGDGIAVLVPAGAKHNIINISGSEKLKMYTIYSPAHHRDGVLHETKEIAQSDKEEFDGIATE